MPKRASSQGHASRSRKTKKRLAAKRVRLASKINKSRVKGKKGAKRKIK